MFVGLICVLLAVPSAMSLQLTAQQKQEMLDVHNLLRAQTARGQTAGQPGASNMMLMEWSDALATSSDRWVSKCVAGHDSSAERAEPNYPWVGQNWAGSYNKNHSTRTIAWFDEYKFYTYSSQSCSDVCGHYTQVVWAKSLVVGCAYANCNNYPQCVVCNYGPGGNYNGEKPYQTGEVCTNCMGDYTYCMGGVCANKGQCQRAGVNCKCTLNAASCQNGGTFDAENCQCKCSGDYFGTKCDQKCANRDGWDYTCNSKVKSDMSLCKSGYGPYCTKTCNLCTTSSGDVSHSSVIPRVLGAGNSGGQPSTQPPTTTTAGTTQPPTTTTAGTTQPPTTTTAGTTQPPTTTTAGTTQPPTTTTAGTTQPPTTTTAGTTQPPTNSGTKSTTTAGTTQPPTTTTAGTTQSPTTTGSAAGCSDIMGESRCASYKEYCWAGTIKVLCGKTCNDCNANTICKDWTSTCAPDQCWCYIRKALCKVTCNQCSK